MRSELSAAHIIGAPVSDDEWLFYGASRQAPGRLSYGSRSVIPTFSLPQPAKKSARRRKQRGIEDKAEHLQQGAGFSVALSNSLNNCLHCS